MIRRLLTLTWSGERVGEHMNMCCAHGVCKLCSYIHTNIHKHTFVDAESADQLI